MRYLLLCCFDEKQWEAIPDARRGGIMREYGELLQSLDRSGQHLASAQLRPSSTASTVRGRSGKPVVTEEIRVKSLEINKVPDDRFDMVPRKEDVIEDLRGMF